MHTLSLAAPSWVMPGTMAQNAFFLADKVPEVGLCCFEAASSAAMPEAELPATLATLPLRWHVHLPTDLPPPCPGAPQNGEKAAHAALAVWDRVAFLEPWLAVLHLPPYGKHDGPKARQGAGQGDRLGAGLEWLEHFLRVWTEKGLAPERLAVENVCGASPMDYATHAGNPLWDMGLSFCLDVGHALAFGQENLWNGNAHSRACLQRLRLTHWSAPGPDGHDRHLPLTEWTPSQRADALQAMRIIHMMHMPREACHKACFVTDSPPACPVCMLEVFNWEGFSQSRSVLNTLWKEAAALPPLFEGESHHTRSAP